MPLKGKTKSEIHPQQNSPTTYGYFEKRVTEDVKAGKTVLLVVDNQHMKRRMKDRLQYAVACKLHDNFVVSSVTNVRSDSHGWDFDTIYWNVLVHTLLQQRNWQELVEMVENCKRGKR